MSLYAHSCFSERHVARDDIGKACHPPMIRTACPIHRDASVEPKLAVHGAPFGGPQHMVMSDADRIDRKGVVEGQRVSVRVVLGGALSLKAILSVAKNKPIYM